MEGTDWDIEIVIYDIQVICQAWKGGEVVNMGRRVGDGHNNNHVYVHQIIPAQLFMVNQAGPVCCWGQTGQIVLAKTIVSNSGGYLNQVQ